MTEDNTTTATSNFAFKAAAENAVVPIIRAPLHVDSEAENRARRLKRRSSNNSNTTAETDELSTEEHEDNCYRRQESYRCHCDHCHCCDHTMEDSEPKQQRSLVQMRNECVKIKRKRFIEADDYCSSCSRCSSCSCSHIHTSSCSSFEEWHLDERQSTRSAPNSHAFTVSADCHHCNPQRRPIVSSTCDMGQEDRHYTGDEVLPQPLIHETSDSSGHTSRRSSVSASFCSCTSNTCCCCDDSTTGQMCTARDVTLTTSIVGKLTCTDGEEQHSSTLTPLTNPSSVVSTPVGDDGEVTIRSFSQALTDDTSSQSHSADYYSLSSNQQQTLDTPCKPPILLANLSTDQNVPNVEVIDTVLEADDPARKARRQCKHFSKHHRHKRPDSPTDSYLWRSVSLVTWPAIDVNSLLQQTIRQSAILQETTQQSAGELAKAKQKLHLPTHPQEASTGSNDSSSTTLTSIVTIAKYPPPTMSATRSLSRSLRSSQPSSIQSLSAVTAICGNNGSSVITTTSAPNSGRVKRNSKFSPLAADAFNCDPMLNAAQERRSTEIIL